MKVWVVNPFTSANILNSYVVCQIWDGLQRLTFSVDYTQLDLLTIIPFLSVAYSVHYSCRRYIISWGIPRNVTFCSVGLLIIRIYVAWPSRRLLTFLLVFPVVSFFFRFYHEELMFELDDQVCFVSSYILADSPLVFNVTIIWNTTAIPIR